MEFAQKVTLEPNQITSQDIDLLREKGLSDRGDLGRRLDCDGTELHEQDA